MTGKINIRSERERAYYDIGQETAAKDAEYGLTARVPRLATEGGKRALQEMIAEQAGYLSAIMKAILRIR